MNQEITPLSLMVDRCARQLQRIAELERENAELKAQNVTFRNAQKACEDCDAPTMDQLHALSESLGRTLDLLNGLCRIGMKEMAAHDYEIMSRIYKERNRLQQLISPHGPSTTPLG